MTLGVAGCTESRTGRLRTHDKARRGPSRPIPGRLGCPAGGGGEGSINRQQGEAGRRGLHDRAGSPAPVGARRVRRREGLHGLRGLARRPFVDTTHLGRGAGPGRQAQGQGGQDAALHRHTQRPLRAARPLHPFPHAHDPHPPFLDGGGGGRRGREPTIRQRYRRRRSLS